MADQSLFEQLKSVLDDLKKFLDGNKEKIKPAVQAIASLVPQVTDLINKLVELLGKMKTEIHNLDVGSITGLTEFVDFTGKIPTFLEAAKKLLPNESASIDTIANVVDVVTGLPSVGDIKQQLEDLLQAISDDLAFLLKP